LVVGYDHDKERILCQNSWGVVGMDINGWKSPGGLFWMKYQWILDWEATDDFWMCRAVKMPKFAPPRFPSAVSPGFHDLASSEWDGNSQNYDETGEDFITPKLARLDQSSQLSCVFTNDTRYLLISDVSPLTTTGSAALVFSRVIRPYSEIVQFGAYTAQPSANLEIFFRLAVWEVPANADLFMTRGQNSKNWAISERQGGLHSFEDEERFAAAQWIEKSVVGNPDAADSFGCSYPGAHPLCYLLVGLTSKGVSVAETDWDTGSKLHFSSEGYDDIKRIVMNATETSGAWKKIESSFFLDGVTRTVKFTGTEANAFVKVWESE
jgi:hypothetical protein